MSRRPRAGRDLPGQGLLFDADRYCCRCGLRLSADASIERGYGETCFHKVKGATHGSDDCEKGSGARGQGSE